MERIFISHFSFSTTEKTQFSITHRHTCTDTHMHNTQTSTSFADKNDWVKLVSASSDFLNLLPTDSIPLQGPGYYLDNRSSGKHCTVMHIAKYTLYAILESVCTVHFETKQYEYNLNFHHWNWWLSKLFFLNPTWLICTTRENWSRARAN